MKAFLGGGRDGGWRMGGMKGERNEGGGGILLNCGIEMSVSKKCLLRSVPPFLK